MKKIWRIFWFLSGIEALAAAFLLALSPSEQSNAFLFGLSKIKLMILLGTLLLAGVCLRIGIQSKNVSSKWIGGTVLLFAYILVLARIFLSPPIGVTATARSIRERIMPLILWMILFSVQAFLLLLFETKRKIPFSPKGTIVFGLLFLLISSCLFLAFRKGWGLECISKTFYRQGVSLLEGHLVIPLLVLFPLLIIGFLFEKRTNNKYFSIIISIVVWFTAAFIWKSVPFEGRSYFLPALREPNLNFYPASDAKSYDMMAQSILIGNGFRCGITVVRPLYIALLALFHKIAGNDYMRVTDLQIFVLALFPLCVYWIGRLLDRPGIGLLAAAWIIWRETYSIRITPILHVSNSRLLMSDMPMALMVSAMILSGILWRKNRRSKTLAMLCGGLLGMGMLIRTQTFVLLAAFLLLFFFCKVDWKHFALHMLLFAVGCALVFGPWTLWNRIRPNVKMSDDMSEGSYLLKLYRDAANLPGGENEQSLLEIITGHPEPIAEAVTAHFFNNEISSLLVLPERENPAVEAEQFLYDGDLFWYRESSGNVLSQNTGLTVLYIFLISLGAGAVFSKREWIGLFPLIVHLIYNLGNALALNSGFRFILPVDWVLLLYFGFGCVFLMKKLIRICIPENTTEIFVPAYNSTKIPLWIPCVSLLAIGLVLPFCDAGIPYQFRDEEALRHNYPDTDPDLLLMEGMAIYPRYYGADEGDSGGWNDAITGNGESRLVWEFVSRDIQTVMLPMKEAPVTPIPDPKRMVLIGKQQDGYIEAIQIIDPETD